jgi:hypothetical protein
MPSSSAKWTVKPGWEHRAFAGAAPTDADFEAIAVEQRWSAEELEARKNQAYEPTGKVAAEIQAGVAA